VLVSLLAAVVSIAASADAARGAALPSHRVIVLFASDEARARGLAVATAHRPIPGTGRDLLFVPAASIDAALARVRSFPGVVGAEEDTAMHLDLIPSDAYFLTDPWGAGGQWDMRITATNAAWDLQRGSAGVTVAVIDTGADYAHPDVAAALLPGRNLVSTPSAGCAATTTAQDDNGHGTHVSGTIAAVGNNGRGIAGMAFGVRVLPFKVSDCKGVGYTSDTATAITTATDGGARVINLSLGSDSPSTTLQAAVDHATARGSLVVAAAGNCGVTTTRCPTANVASYPAAFPNALAVGATDSNDQPANFSTAGVNVAVSAPGVAILSTYPTTLPSTVPGYAIFSGTSMATPHVAGLAALLLSSVPTATVAQLRTAIVSTAKDVGPPGVDTKTGSGRIDSLAALRSLRALAATPVVTPTPTPAPTAAPTSCTSTVGPGIPAPVGLPAGITGFHASWYGQSGYMTLCPGHSATAVVAYYNSGSRGWVKGRMGEVAYLGTWDPIPGQDRPSIIGGDGTLGSPNTGWPRYDRVAVQPAGYVGPGQVAWFQFTVRAPTVPGTYLLYIRPLIEGAQWMEDYGVYWQVVVRG